MPEDTHKAYLTPSEVAEMLRVLAQSCGSTALAFSMHTHQVAIPAWRWRHQKVAAVEPLLRRGLPRLVAMLSGQGIEIHRADAAFRATKVEAAMPAATPRAEAKGIQANQERSVPAGQSGRSRTDTHRLCPGTACHGRPLRPRPDVWQSAQTTVPCGAPSCPSRAATEFVEST